MALRIIKDRLDRFARRLRNVRNRVYMYRYLASGAKHDGLALRHPELVGSDLTCVIAFEQAWAIELLLELWALHVPDARILVCDNSNHADARHAIRAVCDRYGVPYVGLPPNTRRHVNRSHAQAMQYVHDRILPALQPRTFGFLDHDCIPFRRYELAKRVGSQLAYGIYCPGDRIGGVQYWYLWAGFLFFDYQATRRFGLDFLYDFSKNLDTAGMNYHALYRHVDPAQSRFADRQWRPCTVPGAGQERLQIIDDAWWHIGGIGYKGDHTADRALLDAILARIRAGEPFYA
ncbi:MAG: hypothetical protein KGI67_06200 [Pseudomonadota bacterium]|nr:hypothetical protein [Pseudomonadota bacterium]